MNRLGAAAVVFAAICAAGAIGPTAQAADILNEEVYREDIEALTRYPHRLAGVGEYAPERRDALTPLLGDPPDDAKARADEQDDQVERLLELTDNADLILPGPGSLAASRYVQNRLEGIAGKHGLDASQFRVFTQEFDVVQPMTTECRLFVDGEEVESETPDKAAMYAMRPNALMAPVTPAEGLAGESLYVGRGALGDYGHNDANFYPNSYHHHY